MLKILRNTLFILPLLGLGSCAEQAKEDSLEQLDKKSAREVTLMTVSKGDSVLHITRQHIWFNGEKIADKTDTLITANKVNTWNDSDSSKTLSQVPIFVTVQ